MNAQECISAAILEAARAAVPADVERLLLVPDCGPRNKPLMPLLIGLVEAVRVTAAAVADNAMDEHHPLEFGLSAELAGQCRAIASDLMNAAAASPEGWSLPSMTGKELV